ncbi:hypothetical protein [Amycolatopsis aidingensis]|uniref:hypothetical protein n=1 Tax=Amycolatopsis aidingensis TaxID=2842453 RepID=UPI001E3187A2|nr:hypothetical protein [Amycolatopsis aidingensis]
MFTALGLAVGLSFAVAPSAAAATPDEHCVYSVTAQTYDCYDTRDRARAHGERLANTSAEIIGGMVFEHINYGGRSLTLLVPEPCPKNDRVDYWFPLENHVLRNEISSVQGWSTCWVWLYREDGSREGPYRGDHADVGSHINDQTWVVGLS